LFHSADNRHPAEWAAVALEESDTLPRHDIQSPSQDPDIDFEMPLMRWRRNYIHCLKIAAQELAGGPAAKSMQHYMDWVFTDFQIGGAALGLACLMLAPGAPRRGLLSGIRSQDRARAIGGVRRAAWDLTVVSQYVEAIQQQKERNRPVLLCSFDAGLKRIARMVTGDIEHVDDLWKVAWGEKLGSRFMRQIEWMHQNLDDPSRMSTKRQRRPTIDELIRDGEEELLRWCAE
jgi:hypothetical protein